MDVFATPSGGILHYQYLNNCKYNAMNSTKSHFIAKYNQCKWQTTIHDPKSAFSHDRNPGPWFLQSQKPHHKCISIVFVGPAHRDPELIPVLGSQPACDVSHEAGGRLPVLSTRPAVTPTTFKRAPANFAAWWTEARRVWTVCLRLLPGRAEPAQDIMQAVSKVMVRGQLLHWRHLANTMDSPLRQLLCDL